jgi:hypothetical protein
VLGIYVFNTANNCGDLDEAAPQEIRSPGQACTLNYISVNDGGPGLAINGGATIGPDGSFSGATLTLGTATSSPCSASWSEVGPVMTVTCGAVGSECTMELRRTGP